MRERERERERAREREKEKEKERETGGRKTRKTSVDAQELATPSLSAGRPEEAGAAEFDAAGSGDETRRKRNVGMSRREKYRARS